MDARGSGFSVSLGNTKSSKPTPFFLKKIKTKEIHLKTKRLKVKGAHMRIDSINFIFKIKFYTGRYR